MEFTEKDKEIINKMGDFLSKKEEADLEANKKLEAEKEAKEKAEAEAKEKAEAEAKEKAEYVKLKEEHKKLVDKLKVSKENSNPKNVEEVKKKITSLV